MLLGLVEAWVTLKEAENPVVIHAHLKVHVITPNGLERLILFIVDSKAQMIMLMILTHAQEWSIGLPEVLYTFLRKKGKVFL